MRNCGSIATDNLYANRKIEGYCVPRLSVNEIRGRGATWLRNLEGMGHTVIGKLLVVTAGHHLILLLSKQLQALLRRPDGWPVHILHLYPIANGVALESPMIYCM